MSSGPTSGSASNGSSSYCFPVLGLKELIVCFSQMDVTLTIEDIKNPSQYNYRQLFEHCLALVSDTSRESLRAQSSFSALSMLGSYPELHDDSTVETQLTQHLLRLFTSVGVRDVTITDLYEPQYPRNKKLLSAIINFIKYREEKLDVYSHYQSEYDTVAHSVRELEVRVREKLLLVEERRAKHVANVAPVIESLSDEVKSLEHEINAFNSQHSELRETIKAKKSQLKTYTDAVAANSDDIEALEREMTSLNSQYLKSPERVKNTIKVMNDSIVSSKNSMVELSNNHRAINTRMMEAKKINTKLAKRIELLDALNHLQSKILSVQSQYKDLEKMLASHQSSLQASREREDELLKKKLGSEEKLLLLKKNYEKKKSEIFTTIKEIQQELSAALEQQRFNDACVEENSQHIERLLREIQELKMSHERAMKIIHNKWREMHLAVRRWQEKLMTAMALVDQPSILATPRAIKTNAMSDHSSDANKENSGNGQQQPAGLAS